MRSTRNTVGGVFAAITAGISLVMAIWDVDYDNVIRKHFCRKTVFVIFCSVVSREYF